MPSTAAKLASEFVGMALLACVVVGSGIMGTNLSPDAGVALLINTVSTIFALAILILILGPISGAHFNPAVTVAFATAGRFDWPRVPAYLGAQFTGALAASGLIRALFPTNPLLGATLPSGSALQSFILEVVLTFFLMLVILQVSSGAKEKGITAGIAIGATVGLEALFAGPICGASMNPARSLGPAVIALHLDHLWIYLIAPALGALLAVPTHRMVQEPR